VQTLGAYPLKRAYDLLAPRSAASPAGPLRYAATHRHEFMWPWEQQPHSIAHGILDDETYDWLAVVTGMFDSGGSPLVVT
jgi:threonine synthase